MAAIRSGLSLSGRLIRFSSDHLGEAFESIQLNHPKLIAVDALFAATPSGHAFLQRVEKLTIRGSAVRLIVRCNGSWTTTPCSGQSLSTASPTLGTAHENPIAVAPIAVVAPPAVENTRRAHRFQVLDPVKAVVVGGHARLVNISVLGAQVTSGPVLRPKQTVKIALPDAGEMLRLTAHVAWSTIEQVERRREAYYRAGLEFTDAARHTLENYCHRHCAEEPLPSY